MTASGFSDDADPSKSQSRLIDECCDAFESAWEQGKRPRIEEYLDKVSPEEWRDLLQELLRSEWELSVKAGVVPDQSDYLRRFPNEQSIVESAWRHFSDEPPIVEETPVVPRNVDHFELVEEIGSGAFGVVWKARDTKLDRLVAVKFPRPGVLDEGASRRFIREARMAASLRHPNIVAIYDIGNWKNSTYLVSEYVEGEDLATLLEKREINLKDALTLSVTIADALQHAHEAGIIHRDLKPHNILIDHKGEPRITDFGLARHSAGDPILSQEGKILGTPAYMSPEQILGRSVDSRSDIFGFGVLLYQLLTRRLPFDAQTVPQVFDQVLHEPAKPPSSVSENLVPSLDAIVTRCLQKKPDQRFAEMREVSTALRNVGSEFDENVRRKRYRMLVAAILVGGVVAGLLFQGKGFLGSGGRFVEKSVAKPADLQASVDILGEVSVIREGEPMVFNGLGMVFQWVDPGTFRMGQDISEDEDSNSSIQVELDYGFWMSPHEVTQGQYSAVMGSNPSHYNQEYLRTELDIHGEGWRNYPVDSLNWREAMAFCETLTALAHDRGVIPSDYLFRLPTEVEWEYVCRSGGESIYFPGGDLAEIESVAWSSDDFSGDSHTERVGLKAPNRWGFYDMLGNVAEFCLDQYWMFGDHEGKVLKNWISEDDCGVGFIQRGGHNDDPRHRLTATMRTTAAPFEKGLENGMRLVLSKSHPYLQRALSLVDDPPFEIPKIQVTMNWIRPGHVLMGEPDPSTPRGPDVYPQTEFEIAQGFWIAETEVTELQYEIVTGEAAGRSTGLKLSGLRVGYDLPKVNITWFEAVTYCELLTEWLRKEDLLPDGTVIRLPTEAEWEWACLRCFESIYHFGGRADASFQRRARFLANSDGSRGPVKGKGASPGGLHGMYGNVKEWCLDWKYDYSEIAGPDPMGSDPAAAEGMKSLRGGDYASSVEQCTGTVRHFALPSTESPQTGFRIVLARPLPREEWMPAMPNAN